MHSATVIFNRQVIRLCKGVLKAWEQWVDEVDREVITGFAESPPHIAERTHHAEEHHK